VLLQAGVALVALIVLANFGGAAMLGTIAVSLAIWVFAAYQLRRFWVRKNNPVVEI
jgi:apolipoprotein N-acyltransferase